MAAYLRVSIACALVAVVALLAFTLWFTGEPAAGTTAVAGAKLPERGVRLAPRAESVVSPTASPFGQVAPGTVTLQEEVAIARRSELHYPRHSGR